MSKNFETIIKSATSQFFSQIQDELVHFVWEKINNHPTREGLQQAIAEFFGEKVEKIEKQVVAIEKPVEKVEKPKKTKKAEHTCERRYVPTGEKTDIVCGNNANDQVEGVWVCGKHKNVKKTTSSKKKPTSLFDGIVGTPVPKKVVGELPNESIPPELENLVADMDGKISEQIDNYIGVVEKEIPKEIVEDKKVEAPVEPVKKQEVEQKPEEEKPKKKVEKKKKDEVVEQTPEPVEEKTVPLMTIPTLEEMEKEEEAPKKKKIIKRVKKVVKTVQDPALAALDD